MTDQELMQSTPEEQEYWLKCVRALPGLQGFSGTGYDAKGNRIPWGAGPHCIKYFREIVDIVKPKRIWECGFNLGYSSAVWLDLCPDAFVLSIDISDKRETMRAAEILYERHPNRFIFRCIDSKEFDAWNYPDGQFDLAFIDGDHEFEAVNSDINKALEMKIPYFLMDDILERFGPGVQKAIDAHPQLKLVKEMGNMALYANTEVTAGLGKGVRFEATNQVPYSMRKEGEKMKAMLRLFMEDGKFVIEINAKEIIPKEDMEAFVYLEPGMLGALKCQGIIKLNFKAEHNGAQVNMLDSDLKDKGIKLIPQ